MGRRKRKNKKPSSQGESSQSVQELWPTNLPKPRFLIITRNEPEKTMEEFSLLSIKKTLHSAVGKLNSIKNLYNGTVLIETKAETQYDKLIKIKFCPPKVPVKITPHRWFNISKGVIKSITMSDKSPEEMLQALKAQLVIDVKPIMTRSVNDDEVTYIRSCAVILTIGRPTLPKGIDYGGILYKPTPFVPNPKICYRCYKYGHIAKFCKADNQLCRKCNQPGHARDDCGSGIEVCANCTEKKESGHSTCIGYLVHRKIMEIDCILKNMNFDF